MGPGHVGLGPGLIDEDQAGGINPILILAPAGAAPPYIPAIPLARDQRLFLCVMPSRRRNRLIIPVSALTPRSSARRRHIRSSVMSGCSARSVARKSRCGLSADGRWPPVPMGVRLPVRRNRCTHLIAADSLTPKRRATAHVLHFNSIDHTITQILRIAHTSRPPHPASSLNHICPQLGTKKVGTKKDSR